jgi:DNA-binding MarR family transcriptional regulator
MPEDHARSQDRPGESGRPRNTTALLGIAYQALGRRIVDGVNAAGYPNRPAHSAVMAHIDIDGGTRLTTLAERANITPQAVGELIDDLERLGYVARAADPDDRRAKRIVLTKRGHACVAAAIATIANLERDLERLLGGDVLANLQEQLTRISAAAAAMDEGDFRRERAMRGRRPTRKARAADLPLLARRCSSCT